MSIYVDNLGSNLNSTVGSRGVNGVNGKPNMNNGKSVNEIPVSKDLVAAAGFNVETPIVNAIIGNITGVLPTKKNGTSEPARCNICDCEVTSSVTWTSHINGSRHRKRLKSLDIMAHLKQEKGVSVDSTDSASLFRCELCCLTVNSAQQLELHIAGSKHKRKMTQGDVPEADSSDKPEKSAESPPKKMKKEKQKSIVCNVCDLVLNSQIQYDQHLSSRKHKNKLTIYSSLKHYQMEDRKKEQMQFRAVGVRSHSSSYDYNMPHNTSKAFIPRENNGQMLSYASRSCNCSKSFISTCLTPCNSLTGCTCPYTNYR